MENRVIKVLIRKQNGKKMNFKYFNQSVEVMCREC